MSIFDLSSEGADRLLGLSNIALVAGLVIALVATVGTIWASSVIGKYSAIRQAQTDLRIAEATDSSKQADARAAEANLAAARANERSNILEQNTAELKRQAEEAKAETARVNERIRKMQTIRRLSEKQKATLSEYLRSEEFKYEPRAEIRVFAVEDAEAKLYAMDFISLLKDGHVNYYPTPEGKFPNEGYQLASVPYGVAFVVNSLELTHGNKRYVKLFEMLQTAGIDVGLQVNPSLKEYQATIDIHRKPAVG